MLSNRRVRIAAIGAVGTAVALILAGCGTGTPTAPGAAAAGGAGTVSVDVGTMKVQVPSAKLRLGIFFNAQTNAWQVKVAETIKKQAEALGWTTTLLDANFDLSTRLNQLQTAATSKSFDAAIVVPIDDSECTAVTQTLPAAGTIVSVLSAPICGRSMKAGDELWAPGTLNYVGGDTSASYYKGWFDSAAKLNPGPQKVAIVIGPELSPFTVVQKSVADQYAAANPNFKIADYIYTDYTTPTGYSSTLTYLQSHPDTTLLMSVYTPDLTRGVVNAVEASGKKGAVKIIDIGGAQYSADQISAGTVQATLGFFPDEDAMRSVQSIKDAVDGKTPARFVSVVPSKYGTVDAPLIITKDNLSSFTPEY